MSGQAHEPPSAVRPIDPAGVQRFLRRLLNAAQAPWLHGEVARRMIERLSLIKQPPAVVLDWWSHLGASHELLRQACPNARLVAVEPNEVRRAATQRERRGAWWALHRRLGASPVVQVESEVAEGTANLVWSNMVLHGGVDPQAVMLRWQRALAMEGFLMFSTLGPGSLPELRDLYVRQGWGDAFASFVDMHDLGDMLVHAGFADPVMDQEQITLTWPDARALLAELRTLGGNASPRRHGGLRTPRWRAALEAALQSRADASGRMALSFEVVYGHAFKPLPRPRLEGHTEIALGDMRAIVRASRR